jgi:hypothetical protein
MFNRRTFLKTGAAALPLATALNALDPASAPFVGDVAATSAPAPKLVPLPPRLAPLESVTQPWQQKVRRVGQSNMTEHDPAAMNIEEWADYWHSAGADMVFVSVTGILAFYPSKVPFHRHGKFLNNRDFFGECVAAAKKRDMRVVARMSPDLNWGDALEAHPEWAMRYRDGSVQFSGEDPRLFKTCMFSTYMDDYIPAIIREVNLLYKGPATAHSREYMRETTHGIYETLLRGRFTYSISDKINSSLMRNCLRFCGLWASPG